MGSAFSDDDLQRLGITRELADHIDDLVESHGPLTEAERKKLAVLLEPSTPAHPNPHAEDDTENE